MERAVNNFENLALAIQESIVQTLPEQFDDLPLIPPTELMNKLSFTHFIELIKFDQPLKRCFMKCLAK